MKSGASLSALVLCGIIVLPVRSCRDYCEFTPIYISAYVMIGAAIIAGIMALTAIIGGIVLLLLPKKEESNTKMHTIVCRENAAHEV